MPSHRPLATTLLGLVLTTACGPESGCRSSTSEQAASNEPAPLEFADARAPFINALADLDDEIRATRARADKQPKGWLVLEKLANLHLARARLSGDYDDYEEAERALDQAFERAPEGAGPFITRAALNSTMHRVHLVEADLDKAAAQLLLDEPTQAVIEGMRADLELQRGNYALGRTHAQTALELGRTTTSLARLGLIHWQLGEYDRAEALYRDALAAVKGPALEPRAWIHLQLGLMDLDRGRYDDAFNHYKDGAEILPGWWLLEEHIAEIAVLTGRTQQARALYEAIIERTGKAEFMDAMAELALARKDQAEADRWIARARELYEAELARFPEASYGHALGHYLAFGPPERALELAEANHSLRPNVEAKRDLAQARLGTGDLAGAKAMIDEALATPVERADVLWLAASVYEQSGDKARAGQLRTAAKAIDPHIGD